MKFDAASPSDIAVYGSEDSHQHDIRIHKS